MSEGMAKAMAFVEESRSLGYSLNGSIFKVDYNGKSFTVGFWIRAEKWDGKMYQLKSRIGKGKHNDFDQAVEIAIQKAKGLV